MESEMYTEYSIDNVEELHIHNEHTQDGTDDSNEEMPDDLNSKENVESEREILWEEAGFTLWKQKMGREVFLDINMMKIDMDKKTKAFRHKMLIKDNCISIVLPKKLWGLKEILKADRS